MPDKSRILVVDDQEIIQKLIMAVLSPEHDVTCTSDGEQAIALAQEIRPDLILLDVNMPGLSGYEVCTKLKEKPETRDFPIVFLTGEDSAESEVKGLRLGATDFIRKPVMPEVLTTRVNLILDNRRMTRYLEYLARTDPLTGAYNRRHFMETSTAEIHRSGRYEKSLSLVMLDIDHFKSINDTFGHDVGDEAIRQTVAAVQSQLRTEDTLGRLGGEEFAALLPETDAAGATTVAERIRQEIKTISIDTPKGVCSFTSSFGIALFRPEDKSDHLLKRADDALYMAKEGGRDRVVVYPDDD